MSGDMSESAINMRCALATYGVTAVSSSWMLSQGSGFVVPNPLSKPGFLKELVQLSDKVSHSPKRSFVPLQNSSCFLVSFLDGELLLTPFSHIQVTATLQLNSAVVFGLGFGGVQRGRGTHFAGSYESEWTKAWIIGLVDVWIYWFANSYTTAYIDTGVDVWGTCVNVNLKARLRVSVSMNARVRVRGVTVGCECVRGKGDS